MKRCVGDGVLVEAALHSFLAGCYSIAAEDETAKDTERELRSPEKAHVYVVRLPYQRHGDSRHVAAWTAWGERMKQ